MYIKDLPGNGQKKVELNPNFGDLFLLNITANFIHGIPYG
jgi:hypothetical protein